MPGLILLADDDPVVREVIARGLRLDDWSILEVTNGREALSVIERENFVDGVIFDLAMPGLGGIEALLEVGKRGLRLPPIILLSGAVSEDLPPLQRLCGALKVRRFFAKPIEPARVVLAARCHFRNGDGFVQ